MSKDNLRTGFRRLGIVTGILGAMIAGGIVANQARGFQPFIVLWALVGAFIGWGVAFALAYNLANFLRQLALPREVKHWSLTTLRKRLIKIGAKVVSRSKAVTFQMAEVAVSRRLFASILDRIGCLRLVPGTG